MENNTETSSSETSKNTIQQLLVQRKIPENGWNPTAIEYLLSYLSSMDSNNFISKASVGEREGRCFSELVARRHFNFTHGIGRSGDLTEPQPKAAGSSILYKLTNTLLEDLMLLYDIHLKCLLVPVPIGTGLMLCLSTFRLMRKLSKFVLWFREDNEVIFNAILNGGFTPIILDVTYMKDDGILLRQKIEEVGPDMIMSVVSTVACSLPRQSDKIERISEICSVHKIPHIINNDCGLQSRLVMDNVRKGHKNELEVLLQNAGENFMVPVGSILVASKNADVIEKISKMYPGRASSSSVIDIFISSLSLGTRGYNKLLDERESLFEYFKEHLSKLAEKYNKYITAMSFNALSITISLSDTITDLSVMQKSIQKNIRCVRINLIMKSTTRNFSNYEFKDWGTHGTNCLTPFIVFQIPVGALQEEVDCLLRNFDMYLSTL